MVHDKAVQLVVVSVASRQVGIAGIGNLIIGRVVLLECVAVAHRLFTADGVVSFATGIDEADESRKILVFEAPVDGRTYTFGFDKSTIITVALRE